uniref:Rhodanese domain-containing protein n=1 Tax=Salix viminalis TaxID=40686 RepID=A0A6N2NIT0_SALVM
MAAKAVVCYGSSTSSTTLCPVLCPQQLNKRVFFAVNSRRCSININHKSLSFRPKASSRESLEATGIPTSVPVRVAHELHQAGHRYLDVRTPDEFSAGHAARAINIPYMYRGCQLGKRSMMAAADLLAAIFKEPLQMHCIYFNGSKSSDHGACFCGAAVTDIAGGYAAWTQNGLPTDN